MKMTQKILLISLVIPWASAACMDTASQEDLDWVRSYENEFFRECSLVIKGKCRQLNGVNLAEKFLQGIFLDHAILINANLEKADFTRASLIKANLAGANARGASFRSTFLAEANLEGGDFTDADFTRASMSEIRLERAHLENSNLSGANLREANLREAHFNGDVLFDYAYVNGADFENAHGLTNVQKEYLLKNGALNVPADGSEEDSA